MTQVTIERALQIGIGHHQAGRLAEAEGIYRQILAREPRHANALHLLGVLAAQVKRHDVAVDFIRQAIAIDPHIPEAHNNLGNALREMGQFDEAIAAYRQAIELKRDYANAHGNLGNALRDKGEFEEAMAAYRQAIALKPEYAEAYNNLGSVLQQKGQLQEAIGAYREAVRINSKSAEAHSNLCNALREDGQLEEAIVAGRQAIALKPDFADGYGNLGNALQDKGRLEEAIAAYHQAIALQANSPNAYSNLGNALRNKGQLDEAIGAYRHAIALKPDFAKALSNLGNALRDKGQREAAIAACRQALALKPGYAEGYNNLGNALQEGGPLDEAIAAYRQAIALKPGYAEAFSNLGNALKERGEFDEAIAAYRRALALKPNYSEAHSNLIFTMHYPPECGAEVIAEERRVWNRQHAVPLQEFFRPHANDRQPERRLRVGYVSPDFRAHVVGRFVLPLLANHDKERVEVFAYAQVPAPDGMTGQLRTHTDGWRTIVALSDGEAADLIREDGIDILVDLAGHTAHNRLLVFARKPAPIQVTWLGFPGATGLETIDYRLSDAFADPPTALGEAAREGCEEIFRLEPTAWCFAPLAGSPEISPLPALQNQYITFGTFNNFAKVNPQLLEVWAEILRQNPTSHLLLKNMSFGTASVIARLRAFFAARDIAPERLELLPPEPNVRNHLERYRQVDIALDTYPYHGTTTTCEALWMGVPVITLAGPVHAARVGVSLLSNVGLPELVTHSKEEYVRVAGELAGDVTGLGKMRSSLRGKMRQSPLMDAPRFARNIEGAYRQMWRTWCAGGKGTV